MVQGGERKSRSRERRMAGVAWKPKSDVNGSGGAQSGSTSLGLI